MRFWNKSLAATLALAVGIVAWRTSPDIGQLIKSNQHTAHVAAAVDPSAVTTLYLGELAFSCRDTGPATVRCTISHALAVDGRRHN